LTSAWQVEVTQTAAEQIAAIKDRRVQKLIVDRLRELAHDPIEQGKPLVGELQGCYSVRAAGQRYRIIYQVQRSKVVVIVVAVGIRKEGDKSDIYALARRLVKAGLLGEREND
jgi:mRNA interferase RelE/StbE